MLGTSKQNVFELNVFCMLTNSLLCMKNRKPKPVGFRCFNEKKHTLPNRLQHRNVNRIKSERDKEKESKKCEFCIGMELKRVVNITKMLVFNVCIIYTRLAAHAQNSEKICTFQP